MSDTNFTEEQNAQWKRIRAIIHAAALEIQGIDALLQNRPDISDDPDLCAALVDGCDAASELEYHLASAIRLVSGKSAYGEG